MSICISLSQYDARQAELARAAEAGEWYEAPTLATEPETVTWHATPSGWLVTTLVYDRECDIAVASDGQTILGSPVWLFFAAPAAAGATLRYIWQPINNEAKSFASHYRLRQCEAPPHVVRDFAVSEAANRLARKRAEAELLLRRKVREQEQFEAIRAAPDGVPEVLRLFAVANDDDPFSEMDALERLAGRTGLVWACECGWRNHSGSSTCECGQPRGATPSGSA